MFVDELLEVLRSVPYNVWEEIAGSSVDSVEVNKCFRSMSGRNSRPQIVVSIRKGIETKVIEDLDSIDHRNEVLLRCWKPYRDLIIREIEEYNRVLEEPVSFDTAELTEKELDNRIITLCQGDGRSLQLRWYIEDLGLKDVIKKLCNEKGIESESVDELIKGTAFDVIYSIVREKVLGSDVEKVFEGYGIELTDSISEKLEELSDYCKNVIRKIKSEGFLKKSLRRFLYQCHSISDLYRQADNVLRDAELELTEREKEYCRILRLDEDLRREVYSLNERIRNGWVITGQNFFARGYLKGMLYSDIQLLYKYRINIDEKKTDIFEIFSYAPDFRKLWEEIERTVEEYKNYQIKDFSEFEGNIKYHRMDNMDGGSCLVGEIPEYGLIVRGQTEEELYEKLKKRFEEEQEDERIRKCLSLDLEEK